jgi:malto-oligosyltrehalose trehalohydrolase
MIHTSVPIEPTLLAEASHGAVVRADGRVRFRLWAPACERVQLLRMGQALEQMTPLTDGWHEIVTCDAAAGTRYQFVLPNGMRVPDPASRFQPEDVHGPSEVIDSSGWRWTDSQWRGRPWEEAVVYELHVGAFTPEGTFRAAITKLDHLAALGVTAIELMPVADFPGRRNWGYDGVLIYAPDSSYGRPEDLQALVDAAQSRGLMVLLDVVYNHLGPEGNYLPLFAPQFFTSRHKTPWGDAINFDGAGSAAVREFIIQNALYWIREFHFDGLRLDAVHAIRDDSAKHILVELSERIHTAAGDRQVHLILENEENQARHLERDESFQPKFYTAQWNDDVHHVLHTAATGEATGYYRDYLGDTEKLGRALAEGFVYQGETMEYRGTPRGEKSDHLPPSAFIAFLQNHDQVGNRALGDRLGTGVRTNVLRGVASVYLLLPQIPMLFMGEEWNASRPFPFFCDFGPELADAVRKGRREEFARFPEFRDRLPDPLAEATFASAKLRWDELAQGEHAGWLAWYRRILAVRRDSIVPLLREQIRHGGEFTVLGEGAVRVVWSLRHSGQLTLIANLSGAAIRFVPPHGASTIWREGEIDETAGTFPPWSVRWAIEGSA